MPTNRRIARCEECGETREMATKTECFGCYRRRRRAEEGQPVDRHNPAIRREHRHILKAHAQLLLALGELGVSRNHVFEVLDVIEPYVAPVVEFLRAGERERQLRVHVHDDNMSRDEVPVNDEQRLEGERGQS